MSGPKIDYQEIIKKAAGITWRNRYLWWLGFFVVLAGTFGSFFQYFPKNEKIDGQRTIEYLSNHAELIILIAVIIFFIWIMLGILGIIAKGGLIKAIYKINKKEKANFRSAWQDGKKYFWEIFFIGALSILFIIATLIVFMLPIGFLFYNKAYFLGGFLSFLALVIFIPLVFLVTFIRIYGYFYAVLSDLPLGEALENAYTLLQKNIVPSIVISLIFLLIGTVVTIAAFLVAIPIGILFFMVGTLLFFLAKQIGVIIIVFLGSIVLLVVMILGGSIYQVFAHALLVLFFKEIATPKVEEAVETEKVEELDSVQAPNPVVGN